MSRSARGTPRAFGGNRHGADAPHDRGSSVLRVPILRDAPLRYAPQDEGKREPPAKHSQALSAAKDLTPASRPVSSRFILARGISLNDIASVVTLRQGSGKGPTALRKAGGTNRQETVTSGRVRLSSSCRRQPSDSWLPTASVRIGRASRFVQVVRAGDRPHLAGRRRKRHSPARPQARRPFARPIVRGSGFCRPAPPRAGARHVVQPIPGRG